MAPSSPGRSVLFATLCAAVLSAAGCGFFDLRDPVSGGGGSGPPRRSPTAPDSVLFNYENAIRYKLAGQAQLEESMSAEEFLMTLDPLDAADTGVESIGFTQTINAFSQAAETLPDSFYFAFDEERQTETNTGTEATYNRIGYVFRLLTVVGPDSAEVNESFAGRADLRLVLDTGSGNWVLTEWEDAQGEGAERTWGFFLGNRVAPS